MASVHHEALPAQATPTPPVRCRPAARCASPLRMPRAGMGWGGGGATGVRDSCARDGAVGDLEGRVGLHARDDVVELLRRRPRETPQTHVAARPRCVRDAEIRHGCASLPTCTSSLCISAHVHGPSSDAPTCPPSASAAAACACSLRAAPGHKWRCGRNGAHARAVRAARARPGACRWASFAAIWKALQYITLVRASGPADRVRAARRPAARCRNHRIVCAQCV